MEAGFGADVLGGGDEDAKLSMGKIEIVKFSEVVGDAACFFADGDTIGIAGAHGEAAAFLV